MSFFSLVRGPHRFQVAHRTASIRKRFESGIDPAVSARLVYTRSFVEGFIPTNRQPLPTAVRDIDGLTAIFRMSRFGFVGSAGKQYALVRNGSAPLFTYGQAVSQQASDGHSGIGGGQPKNGRFIRTAKQSRKAIDMRQTIIAVGRPLKFIERHEQFRCSQVTEAFEFVRFFGVRVANAAEASAGNAVGKESMADFVGYRKSNTARGAARVVEDDAFGRGGYQKGVAPFAALALDIHRLNANTHERSENGEALDGDMRYFVKEGKSPEQISGLAQHRRARVDERPGRFDERDYIGISVLPPANSDRFHSSFLGISLAEHFDRFQKKPPSLRVFRPIATEMDLRQTVDFGVR